MKDVNLKKPFIIETSMKNMKGNGNKLETAIVNLLNLSYRQLTKFGSTNLVPFRIVIPRKFKWELSQLLHQMNISTETLYPGLERMTKSLAHLHLRDPIYILNSMKRYNFPISVLYLQS